MTTQPVNKVVAVGALDIQRRRGKDLTLVDMRNELRGREERVMLQVASPFGKSFALPIHFDGVVPGSELLETAAQGTLFAATGQLEWEQRTDRRYMVNAGDRGRQSSELTFRVSSIRLPEADDEQGCDVFLEGIVQTPARIMRHSFKSSVLLAVTNLQVHVERRRRGSRVVIRETERVPVVVPINHPHAAYLLRPGNQVFLEGMLERVLVDLRGEDVDRAVAALEAGWRRQQQALQGSPEQLRAAEHEYRRRRGQLGAATRSRVVAGYVELIEGTPATVREAQDLRRAFVRKQRQRAQEQERQPADPAPADAQPAEG